MAETWKKRKAAVAARKGGGRVQPRFLFGRLDPARREQAVVLPPDADDVLAGEDDRALVERAKREMVL